MKIETPGLLVLLLFPKVSTERGILSCTGKSCVNENFKKANGDGIIYETVRYGHYIELDCCCEGNLISWTKWSNKTNEWQQFVPDSSEVKFLNNKQILSFQSSTFEDRGLYKCSVRNGSVVSHTATFILDVVACDKLARGPYPVSPVPCEVTITQETDVLTLPCTGYFGCEEEGDIRIVTWFVSLDRNKKDDWLEAKSADKRYKQIDFKRDGNAVEGSNLTVEGVSAVDFNRKFMCLLASPQMMQGQTKLIVTLQKDKNDKLTVSESAFSPLATLTGVSVIACFSVIVNAVMCVLAYHKQLRQKQRTNKDIAGTNTCQKWTPVELQDVACT